MKNIDESVTLSQIFSNLVVELACEDTPLDEALQAVVRVTKDLDKVPHPKGVINELSDGEFPITLKGDMVYFIVDSDDEAINNKGGEKMKNRLTSGERKITSSIVKNIRGLKVGVSKEYLLFSLSTLKRERKIPKRVKEEITLNFLLKRGVLREEDEKLFLTKFGEEFLSQ